MDGSKMDSDAAGQGRDGLGIDDKGWNGQFLHVTIYHRKNQPEKVRLFHHPATALDRKSVV